MVHFTNQHAMPLTTALLLLPVLILLNAFFVAAEYAIVALRRAQIATLTDIMDELLKSGSIASPRTDEPGA